MGRNSRLSKDQLRKIKKKKELARRGKRESLAYRGNKYRTEKHVRWMFAAERAINEASIICKQRLTDEDVERSLEDMVRLFRRGTLSLSGPSETAVANDQTPAEDMLTHWVLQGWRGLAENEPRPNRDDLAGILRTILGSLDTWRTAGGNSRGYLTYLEGFLRKAGVETVEVRPGEPGWANLRSLVISDSVGEEGDEDEEDDGGEDEIDDDLLHVGRVWRDEGEAWAAERFRWLADEWKGVGNARHVAETCQRLLGEADRNTANREAMAAFAIISQQAIDAAIEKPAG